ncbi:MAG: exodeoxyribonuclease V subunit beta [Rubrivivax sp.]
MAEPLDPLTLPLAGSRLIEASAGTGKTWTIAALVLRLVLGPRMGQGVGPELGQPPAGQAEQEAGQATGQGAGLQESRGPLLPSQILVMTFTRAATRELVQRIRGRLVEAGAVFRGERPAPADDTVLQGLLAAWADPRQREAAAQQLALAADAMDEAAVYTLDGWCQRVLREGLGPEQAPFLGEVLPDALALRLAAARDVWRTEIQPLSGEPLALALSVWPSPEVLCTDALQAEDADLVQALGQGPETIIGLAQAVHAECQRLAAERGQARAEWSVHLGELRNWFERLWAHPARPSRPQPRHVKGWLDALEDWVAGPMDTPAPFSPAARRELALQSLQQLLPADWAGQPLPAAAEALQRLLNAEPTAAHARLRAAGVLALRSRLASLKRQREQLSHTDVQQRVADALDPARGESARRLRERLLQRWPVALVDEFQDTSPRQLAILERTWGLRQVPRGHALLLIGDPKQSIYAFRGADIHSFLQARRATSGRHHSLGTNYRSSGAMVGAVNALWSAAQQREAEGAFRFGRDGEAPQALPFQPVVARGLPRTLHLAGQAAPAMLAELDDTPVASGMSRRRLAQRCADQLVSWLNHPDSGFAPTAGGPLQRLRPQDVAVLVRTHVEAGLVMRALARRGVPSAFLSQKDSVLATAEAEGLLHWLQAAAHPQDMGAVKAAMACELTDLPHAELLALADDDAALARAAQLWRELASAWQTQGVLAMVRLALHRLGAAERWMAAELGERRLTNVLHLAELLQAAGSRAAEGAGSRVGALLRWYQQALQATQAGLEDASSAEDRVLRLERDEQAVRVITLHQSKGLEFPVVMLPFVMHVRQPRPGEGPPWWVRVPSSQGRALTVLAPRAREVQQQRLDAEREDLRLLYVALTRARHHLWLGVSLHHVGSGEAFLWHRSALGWLLTGSAEVSRAEAAAALRAWAVAVPGVVCQDAPPADDNSAIQRWTPPVPDKPLRPLQPYRGAFDRDWSISSYSRLVQGAGGSWVPATLRDDEQALEGQGLAQAPADAPALPSNDSMLAAQPSEPRQPTEPTEPTEPDPSLAWHRFPRGALAGHFLHGQLEWLGERGFALSGNPGLQDALRRRCEQQAFARHTPQAVAWMERLCRTPLPPLGVALPDLGDPLPEMEFWLPLQAFDTAWLDALCSQHLFPGQPRPPLETRALKGLLMGFADLSFLHDGRAWVLDYKSNALGDDNSAYHPQALVRAVLEHRYDVQAALYTLALYRLMKTRQVALQEPSQHLGGALFWFMRGVAAPGAGCVHLAVPSALLQALDERLLAAPEEWLP